ncbi:carboxypeptidase-like regulatory domain-containing protein [Lacinutrix neustonica]|uniref:Carboxypeptidase-like regulatory domain-containing protein n=1 Tax=Lacinutrix neustonica TaxID=2980107 RepID=A0A9E8SET1_9FLAO|nr:carboxypeptidase-like regulatory domain-containing protein [Lacinutrix neustonica]WAC03546.1 carboxypeptidase-like regulatory domain-containing protein [Lacinutrix neustonica]
MKPFIPNNVHYYKRLSFFCLFFILCTLFVCAQNSKEFRGKVVDSESNKELALADLLVVGTNISTITNADGEFLLKVPNEHVSKSVLISFLGYKSQEIPLSEFETNKTKIKLVMAATVLARVDINTPKDAESLVRRTLASKGENYINQEAIMTSFYRETIKKRNKNASLSEAVLKIHKQPYTSNKKDAISIVKARKNTIYSRLDTVALKLQGGPFSTLYTDIIKYQEYIFTAENLSNYEFTFNRSTQINNHLIYVVAFKQKEEITEPLYYGQLFIDAETYALTSATYNLNVSDREAASKLFVRKKPRKARVYPTEAAYRINYRVKNGKWYFGYSNILLTFKVNWENKLFNSRYTLQSEMAITDWNQDTTTFTSSPKDRLRPNSILVDKASVFLTLDFGVNIILLNPKNRLRMP